MFSNLRRVVTGNDASGKSFITSDGPPPASYEMGAGGLYEILLAISYGMVTTGLMYKVDLVW